MERVGHESKQHNGRKECNDWYEDLVANEGPPPVVASSKHARFDATNGTKVVSAEPIDDTKLILTLSWRWQLITLTPIQPHWV